VQRKTQRAWAYCNGDGFPQVVRFSLVCKWGRSVIERDSCAMGVLELILNTISQTWHVIKFGLKLLAGNKENLEFTYRLIRGPTAAQKAACRQSAKHAKNKFRPKQVVAPDGGTRLAEPGERGGALYRTIKASVTVEISEFGIGIGLFFGMSLGYFWLLFIQFAALLPSALYYYQPEYRSVEPQRADNQRAAILEAGD